jgi:hypothetical protein
MLEASSLKLSARQPASDLPIIETAPSATSNLTITPTIILTPKRTHTPESEIMNTSYIVIDLLKVSS